MAQKVILIEDDVFLHDLYKDTLTAAGYEIASAKDGEEGLRVIRSNTDASLILLDIILPKIQGIDVLREIKKDEATKNMSVIVLTNLSEEKIIGEALKLGANAYLVKVNFTPQQVIETVRQYIELREHLKKQT